MKGEVISQVDTAATKITFVFQRDCESNRQTEQKGYSRQLRGLTHQLLFNHWNAVSFLQKSSIIINMQNYFNYSVFQ